MAENILQYLDKRLERIEDKIDKLVALEPEVDDLKDKVEMLVKAYWIRTGAVAAVSAIFGTVITIFFHKG